LFSRGERKVACRVLYRCAVQRRKGRHHGIDMLRSHGISLGRPWVAPLGKGLWELRIRTRRQLRILYFLTTEKTFVLLHAFVKKTREVPESEIQIATRRMRQYLGR